MVQPKETIYRKFKNSELNKFKKDVRTKMQSVNNYETFEEGLPKVLNNHAPLKKKFVPANIVSYMKRHCVRLISNCLSFNNARTLDILRLKI